jgi:hypothetical protein
MGMFDHFQNPSVFSKKAGVQFLDEDETGGIV